MSGPGGGIDSAWRGAEAYHFWLLAHRQVCSCHRAKLPWVFRFLQSVLG